MATTVSGVTAGSERPQRPQQRASDAGERIATRTDSHNKELCEGREQTVTTTRSWGGGAEATVGGAGPRRCGAEQRPCREGEETERVNRFCVMSGNGG
jgi:hypothetical protein